MNEQWIRWEPIAGLRTNYFLEHVHDGFRSLEILLAYSNTLDKKVRVAFAYTMISYTINPISGSIKINKVEDFPDAPFCNNWSFFEVTHSKYIEHLMELSATIVEISDPRHFVILTTNARVDIVASYEPDFSYITMDLDTKTLLYKEMTIPYIICNVPTARIILYEKNPSLEPSELNLALDTGQPIDPAILSIIADALTNSQVPLPCGLVDLSTLSGQEQDSIRKNGVIWRS